jgi:hypothetical protein
MVVLATAATGLLAIIGFQALPENIIPSTFGSADHETRRVAVSDTPSAAPRAKTTATASATPTPSDTGAPSHVRHVDTGHATTHSGPAPRSAPTTTAPTSKASKPAPAKTSGATTPPPPATTSPSTSPSPTPSPCGHGNKHKCPSAYDAQRADYSPAEVVDTQQARRHAPRGHGHH